MVQVHAIFGKSFFPSKGSSPNDMSQNAVLRGPGRRSFAYEAYLVSKRQGVEVSIMPNAKPYGDLSVMMMTNLNRRAKEDGLRPVTLDWHSSRAVEEMISVGGSICRRLKLEDSKRQIFFGFNVSPRLHAYDFDSTSYKLHTPASQPHAHAQIYTFDLRQAKEVVELDNEPHSIREIMQGSPIQLKWSEHFSNIIQSLQKGLIIDPMLKEALLLHKRVDARKFMEQSWFKTAEIITSNKGLELKFPGVAIERVTDLAGYSEFLRFMSMMMTEFNDRVTKSFLHSHDYRSIDRDFQTNTKWSSFERNRTLRTSRLMDEIEFLRTSFTQGTDLSNVFRFNAFTEHLDPSWIDALLPQVQNFVMQRNEQPCWRPTMGNTLYMTELEGSLMLCFNLLPTNGAGAVFEVSTQTLLKRDPKNKPTWGQWMGQLMQRAYLEKCLQISPSFKAGPAYVDLGLTTLSVSNP